VIYSPLDVLELTRSQRERQVVFFAVGFETTAPATALLAQRALAEEISNLKLLVAHVRVAPVLDQLLGDPACAVQGVMAAGHVCTVMGGRELEDLVQRHRRPVVITGFSAEELLQGILNCINQLERGTHQLENAYTKAVVNDGNRDAQALLEQVFEPVDTRWRGLGTITSGGYELKTPFDQLAVDPRGSLQPPEERQTQQTCASGLVLQGLLRPNQCTHFGTSCTPDTPRGAPMVSNEGACSAYYRYHR
jgi:hydrogenase expression/formation protein HypD